MQITWRQMVVNLLAGVTCHFHTSSTDTNLRETDGFHTCTGTGKITFWKVSASMSASVSASVSAVP